MQATIANRQARPRIHFRKSLRQYTRQLMAISGELLALASLTVAMAAGIMILAGLVGLSIAA